MTKTIKIAILIFPGYPTVPLPLSNNLQFYLRKRLTVLRGGGGSTTALL